jgi:hypothetical protein
LGVHSAQKCRLGNGLKAGSLDLLDAVCRGGGIGNEPHSGVYNTMGCEWLLVAIRITYQSGIVAFDLPKRRKQHCQQDAGRAIIVAEVAGCRDL